MNHVDFHKKRGMTICNTNEFVQSQFSDGVLIVRYINKMGTNGNGGVVDGVPLRVVDGVPLRVVDGMPLRVVDGVPLRRLHAILVPG
jgi:hypothetical protein